MTDHLERAPPIIQALLGQKIDASSPAKLRKQITDLRKAFRDQAEWTVRNFEYANEKPAADPGAFSLLPLSGLDLFSHEGACQTPTCRLGYVDQFARTFGIYADQVLLSDSLTNYFFSDHRLSDYELSVFVGDILLLRKMRPLIQTGVVKFRSPALRFCELHMKEFLEEAGILADKIGANTSWTPTVIRADENSITFDAAALFHEGMIYEHTLTKSQKASLQSGTTVQQISQQVLRELAMDQATTAVTGASFASDCGAVVISNSRVGLTALLHAEKRAPAPASFAAWESARETTLPWIGSLSLEQVLQLRSEADTALPRFRQLLATAFQPVDATDKADAEQAQKRLAETVAELKSEALEVEAELAAINVPAERTFRHAAGILGLSIAGYGFASDVLGPVAASTSLLTLLGLIHQVGAREERDQARAKSRPGYVLVKAKEILRHSD